MARRAASPDVTRGRTWVARRAGSTSRLLSLAGLLALAACGGSPEPGQGDSAAPAAADTPPSAASDAAPRDTAPSLERFAQNLLAADEVSLEGLRAAFGEPARVEREPTPNRHIPGQTDTILTVHYDGARFRLYRVSGGRTLIEHADVRDPRFLRWARPTIGTPADSVVAWWGEPLRREAGALVYEDPGPTSTPLRLHVADGRIARIERAYYVD